MHGNGNLAFELGDAACLDCEVILPWRTDAPFNAVHQGCEPFVFKNPHRTPGIIRDTPRITRNGLPFSDEGTRKVCGGTHERNNRPGLFHVGAVNGFEVEFVGIGQPVEIVPVFENKILALVVVHYPVAGRSNSYSGRRNELFFLFLGLELVRVRPRALFGALAREDVLDHLSRVIAQVESVFMQPQHYGFEAFLPHHFVYIRVNAVPQVARYNARVFEIKFLFVFPEKDIELFRFVPINAAYEQYQRV